MDSAPNKDEKDEKYLLRIKRLSLWLAASEIVVALILGWYLKDLLSGWPAEIRSAVQYVVIFIGFAIGLNFIFLQLKIDALLQREVRSIIKKEAQKTNDAITFFDAYFKIEVGSDFKFKEDIVASAKNKLNALARGIAEVEGEDYYNWLEHRLRVRKPQSVRAISYRPLIFYSENPREKNFISTNEEAVRNGVKIKRIFVVKEEEVIEPIARTVLKSQLLNPSIENYVVWSSHVPLSLLNHFVGGGLSIYDNDEVFFDKSYFESRLSSPHNSDWSATNVIPKAAIYFSICDRFASNISKYENIEKYIDPELQRASGNKKYCALLHHLVSWIDMNYPEKHKKQRANLESEINDICEEPQ